MSSNVRKSLYKKAKLYLSKKEELETSKAVFEDEASCFFKDYDKNSIRLEPKSKSESVAKMNPIKITRCQTTKVIFDVKKLRKKVNKDVANKVIEKRYEITDFEGFKAYLKECGVNPKILKDFILVTEEVNQNLLNQASELGEVTLDNISDCFSIQKGKPYYRVSEEMT